MNKELEELLTNHPNNGYVRFHMPRYSALFDAVGRYYTERSSILDIGRSPFTEALSSGFGNIDSLGFQADSKTAQGTHYCFDLNDTRSTDTWRSDLPQYDIIVFSEVIEHLYTSPTHVLAFLHHLLRENGVLIIQTPNAVALTRRAKILLGKNPYELIRENYLDPGHFREYTHQELTSYLQASGFSIAESSYENYFDFQYSHHTSTEATPLKKRIWLNHIYSLVPGSLKPGMLFIARKDVVASPASSVG